MDFDLDDDQQAIKNAARDFLSRRADLRAVRKSSEEGAYDPGLWREIQGLGWPGIAVPEAHGGAGLGLVELVILLEEFGYACAATPFFTNAAAAIMLTHAGSDEQRQRWLPGIVSGEAPGTVGMLAADGGVIAPDAGDAAVVVVVDGPRSFLLPGGGSAARVPGVDITRRYFKLQAANPESLGGDVEAGLMRVEVALSAEIVGVAQRAMEMAVEYAGQRTQFERPIGAYQAVSHRCADMLLEVESARSATYSAAWAADDEASQLPLASSVAKAASGNLGWRVATSALQVHGGIGFTWEHDLHFLVKRGAADARLFGSVSHHLDRVAELSGLGSGVAETDPAAPQLVEA